jgi:hypothetical protein
MSYDGWAVLGRVALEPVGRPRGRLRRVRTHGYAVLLTATRRPGALTPTRLSPTGTGRGDLVEAPGDLSLAEDLPDRPDPSRASFRHVTGDADQIETAGYRDPTAVWFPARRGSTGRPGGWGASPPRGQTHVECSASSTVAGWTCWSISRLASISGSDSPGLPSGHRASTSLARRQPVSGEPGHSSAWGASGPSRTHSGRDARMRCARAASRWACASRATFSYFSPAHRPSAATWPT